MKQLAFIAAAAMLLCAYACAEEPAQDAAATPASATKTVPESPPTKTTAQEPAAPKDNLRVISARAERERVTANEPTVSGTPTANASTPRIDDARRVAEGDQVFKAGRDYIVLTPAQRTSSPPEKVEITEVFMYQCPHCFSFEPFIEKLIADQPPKVNFVRLPAIFNPIAELHAKAYYAANILGVWDQLHTPFFREIHTNRNLMRTEDKVLEFIASQGIERETFATAMRSFEVDSKVRDAKDLNHRYHIDSVPTMVINGKYVTSSSLVKSTQKLRQVIDYLVSKEGGSL